ncbi:MAG TPA: antitoxin Xre/MbcA/ParS toxin-binding domain-containing protein [Flavobacteriaceae bacterium]|nr:antitoxin Xre/MbcA/ParS toxin-binding domain-containing protein [Flavobacteriaceae bacterium]
MKNKLPNKKTTVSNPALKKSGKEWSIKKEGQELVSIKVEPQNSYFFHEKNQDQNILKEPEVLTYSAVEPLLGFLEYNQKEAAVFLEVDPGTISRWKKGKNEIGKLRTKNMLDVDEIIAKGIRIFGSEENFKTWLSTINNALGDSKPIELLKDPYGVAQVEEAIDSLSWGNYM